MKKVQFNSFPTCDEEDNYDEVIIEFYTPLAIVRVSWQQLDSFEQKQYKESEYSDGFINVTNSFYIKLMETSLRYGEKILDGIQNLVGDEEDECFLPYINLKAEKVMNSSENPGC